MSDRANDRDQQLLSALQRLPMAVLVIEPGSRLRAANARAVKLFTEESLTGGLVKERPSHPMSRFVSEVINGNGAGEESHRVLEFPSGNSYRLEVSERSEKGAGRLLVLLISPYAPRVTERLLDKWELTSREREVAKRVFEGQSTAEICAALDITPQTFKTHMGNLFAKTECRSRTELMARMMKGS